MAEWNNVAGLRVVGHNLAQSTNDLLNRFEELGFTPNAEGDMQLNPDLQTAVDALFHVLAGGSVEVKITQRGNPDIVRELQGRLAQSQADSNAINKRVGFYLGVSG